MTADPMAMNKGVHVCGGESPQFPDFEPPQPPGPRVPVDGVEFNSQKRGDFRGGLKPIGHLA